MSDELAITNSIEIENYESISRRVFEEERRLYQLYQQNSQKIPNREKKKNCSLPINKEAMLFFQNERNGTSLSFRKYIHERRDNETSTDMLLQQCSQFISYIKTTLNIQKISIPDLIFDVSINHSLLFHQFFQYLYDIGLKSATILIRINALYHMIQWFRMTQTNHFVELSHVLDRLVIARTRFHAVASNDQKKKTLEKLIEMRQWVQGGLPAVQELMLDSWPYFDALVSLSIHQELKSQQYSWCVGYTLASLWVYGINARAKCIEAMTKKDLKDIEENQFYLSSNFKTSNTYGYQIVSVTDILQIYVKFIRKQRIPDEIDSDEATLFPTYKGTPLTKGEASKKINLVFVKYGYDLSVTKLRDILSTYIEELHSSGKMTQKGEFLLFYFHLLINH